MSAVAADLGSFRDPGGRVFLLGDRVYRTVTSAAVEDFEHVERSGLLDGLVARGQALPATKVDGAVLGDDARGARYVLQHPKLPFVSYPYEWPFAALKAAALLHLDIHLEALRRGVTLSDASAFNIQFIGARPVFIDRLSFVRYRPGEIWAGHRQFCEQFLNPLLLRALFGIGHNAWFRGAQEGIATDDLRLLLRWRHKLSWNVLTNIVLQSAFQSTARQGDCGLDRNVLKSALPEASLRRLLTRLRDWIAGLQPARTGRSGWQDYAAANSYAPDEAAAKQRFVAEFAGQVQPRLLWDLGCNTGNYACAALSAGARYAVGFDFDRGALDAAFARASQHDLPLQVLFLDVANPSSDQGWAQEERHGLQARAKADALLALALVHHLAITRNIPLERLVAWLVGLAPNGVIEFVPKSDPMVRQLLRFRADIFPDYTEEAFLAHVAGLAHVRRAEKVSASGRLLVWFERRQELHRARETP